MEQVTAKIRALLSIAGKRQIDLMEPLNMGSKQSLSNKFQNERWSADDLLVVAQECGARLAFILPDGNVIYF